MSTTLLKLADELPLTCSRLGTCCYGKQVFLNPWELACLAKEKQISTKEFVKLYCDFGGILLRFDGKENHLGLPACSQYIENFGCSVHKSRSLACRLYPLGRQIQNEKVIYIFQGEKFPCLNECSEVLNLPKLTIKDYLVGQEIKDYEIAQDSYLEVMQNLADSAFELLLDTGLNTTSKIKTRSIWLELGKESPIDLAKKIGVEWLNLLLHPTINIELENVYAYISEHNFQLQEFARKQYSKLENFSSIQEASVQMMRIALYLATALGANPVSLAEHWVAVAKSISLK